MEIKHSNGITLNAISRFFKSDFVGPIGLIQLHNSTSYLPLMSSDL
jgi:hypothetical protein